MINFAWPKITSFTDFYKQEYYKVQLKSFHCHQCYQPGHIPGCWFGNTAPYASKQLRGTIMHNTIPRTLAIRQNYRLWTRLLATFRCNIEVFLFQRLKMLGCFYNRYYVLCIMILYVLLYNNNLIRITNHLTITALYCVFIVIA